MRIAVFWLLDTVDRPRLLLSVIYAYFRAANFCLFVHFDCALLTIRLTLFAPVLLLLLFYVLYMLSIDLAVGLVEAWAVVTTASKDALQNQRMRELQLFLNAMGDHPRLRHSFEYRWVPWCSSQWTEIYTTAASATAAAATSCSGGGAAAAAAASLSCIAV